MLYIHLFGRVRVSRGPDTAELKLVPTAQTLLAYLLVGPQRFHPREVLAGLSWGDRPENQARSCLNTALWRLRRALEADQTVPDIYLLTTPAGEVGFNWKSQHWLDLTAFERCATCILAIPLSAMQAEHALQLESVLPLYQGELLEGFYDDWALRERERLRALRMDCLLRLLRHHKANSAYEQALSYGQQILREDPLREEIHREMMRLYAANGQRALALREYETCRATLVAELGIDPMPETEALYRHIAEQSTTVAHSVHTAHIAAIASPEPDQPAAANTPSHAASSLDQALAQLQAAVLNLDAAREDLRSAIDLVRQVSNHSSTPPV